jgi:Tol biopolymer transport system component
MMLRDRVLRTLAGLLPTLGLVCTAAVAQAQSATALPPGMSFVAQDAAGAWSLYRVDTSRAVVRLPTQQEPRQACVAPDGSKLVYTAADGTLRLVAKGAAQETVVVRGDAKRSYTQPCMAADGQEIYAVEMADGKSLETEILRFGSAPDPARIARQPGAQHDPFVFQRRWLVYASVGCSDGCEELLVEIWGRDLLTGKARQLTLLNALSQAPVTDGRRVVFSSNASGTHQLWQVGIDGSGLRRLTDGPTQAVQPALCDGAVHFVRAGPDGATLARLGDDGSVTALPVPGLKSFRALRCL